MSDDVPNLWCKACGAAAHVVGKRSHEQACRKGPVVWTDVNPHARKPKPAPAADPMANVVPIPGVRKPRVARGGPSTYRYRDPEKWRAYMRAYMQRWRARRKAHALPQDTRR
jgi:hypothetical protein